MNNVFLSSDVTHIFGQILRYSGLYFFARDISCSSTATQPFAD